MTDKVLSALFRNTLRVALFIVPVFFLPWTAEMMEFNKQFLLIVLVLLALVFWLVRTIIKKEVQYVGSVFDIPALLLVVVALVASVLSIDRPLSFLGSYEQLTFGFVSLLAYVLLFFLLKNATTSLAAVQRHVMAFAGGALLAMVYFWVYSFFPSLFTNLPLPGATLVGSASVLGVLAALVCTFSLGMLLRRTTRLADVFWGIALAISILTIFLIGFRMVWLVAAIALFALLIFGMMRVREVRSIWLSLGLTFFLVAVIFSFINEPRFLVRPLPLEVGLSNGASLKIAQDTLSQSIKPFLFGTGPETFVYDFSQHRPPEMNTNFAWNIRFSRPFGTMIDLLVGWGFLGSVALIVLALLALGLILHVGVVRPAQLVRARATGSIGGRAAELLQMFWSLGAVWFTLFVAMFLMNLTTTLWVLFWASLALLAVVARFITKGEEASPLTVSLEVSPQYSFLSSFLSILAFGAVVVSGVTLGRFYWAEVSYTQGLKAFGRGALEEAVQEFGQAITFNPYRTQYHLVLARAFLQQAVNAANAPQPNVPLITATVGRAVNEAREATDRSPNNAAAWDTLAAMYANARPVAGNATEWEIRALARTGELEPTNPTTRLRLGVAYLAQNKVPEAKKELEAAITLKPDYVDAFMLLARLHESEGDLNTALIRAGDAVRFAPESAEVLYEFARLSYNRGTPDDLARAEQALQIVVQADQNNANALFSLGLLAERRGDVSRALNIYRRVAELAPANAEVRERIRVLSQ